MKNYKWLSALAVMAGCAFCAAALSVNEEEIRSTGGEFVEFNSYSGPHALIESASSITEIGGNLGRQVAIDLNQAGAYGLNAKYSVIHAVDSSEGSKMDADILFINEDATVDHITNLRRIISGYLIEAYGYRTDDASTIATFITVYNAVYRQNLSVFNAKYKPVVTKNLTEDDCGLSTNWSDWPGSTQIVIPLFDMNSSLSAVDTSVISDKNVIASIKEEDDLGVDERRNLADIKQREAENYTNQAQAAAQNAAQQNRELARQEQEAQKASQNAAQAASLAAANPDDEELQKQAQEAKAAAEEQKQKAEEQKQQTVQAQKEAEKAQAVADKKLAESTTERTEIAKDRQKLLSQALADEQDRNAAVGMIIVDDKKQLASLVKIDSTTGKTVSQSAVRNIRGRTLIPVTETVNSKPRTAGFIALCGEGTAARLCYIDFQSLEVSAQSSETVYEDSVLQEADGYYYCVIRSGNSYYIGRYDSSLNLVQRSTAAVKKETPITVTDKGIIATNSANQVILLNAETLAPAVQQ